MNTEANTTTQHTQQAQQAGAAAARPALTRIWQTLRGRKALYAKVLGATFLLSAALTLSLPNYYQCTVMLAPELAGAAKGSSSLANLASSFGVNIGGSSSGMDAIMPTLYPDLMNSVTFRTSLFPVRVQREDEDSAMTYYDYLLHHQRKPWWTAAAKAVLSLLPKEQEPAQVDPFRLTKQQTGVIETMGKKVVCDVDQKTLVITINVTDQDPLICATMADSVQAHLQEFITDYRTRKARIDLAYNQKLFSEARDRYEKARLRSAAFNDANQKVFLERVRSERNALENEMQLQYRAYSQVAAQLQLAEAKVQEDTPAFTLLQPATVPVKKAGPKRSLICLVFLFLAFIGTTLHILNREGLLTVILQSLRRGSNGGGNFDDEEYYILSKYPPHSENSL